MIIINVRDLIISLALPDGLNAPDLRSNPALNNFPSAQMIQTLERRVGVEKNLDQFN